MSRAPSKILEVRLTNSVHYTPFRREKNARIGLTGFLARSDEWESPRGRSITSRAATRHYWGRKRKMIAFNGRRQGERRPN
jgi:hypothetical protein